MNKVILLGRLTRDPELRTTPSGVNVCSFSLAVNRRFAKEGQQNADFINCVAWRNTAEFVAKYFAKGRMMGVVGSLQTGRYEKDGQTHYTTDVLVDEAYFADSKSSSDASTSAPIQNTTADFGADAGLMPIPADDDLPF
ncbi:MAG: single-stranded DNA-binding protein [Ruminococcaceae bacterium]|nr:single-stranded DNA-binding protein [Oscillospiraceae bacterium]